MHKGTNNSIVFETDRLIVRHFSETDHDHYFSLHGDPVVMQFIRPAKSREECDAIFNESILNAIPHPFMGRWAVDEKRSGNFVGSFVIMPIPGDLEKIQLGYSLLPEYWGRGFATELAREGLNYFRHRTPLQEIYAVIEVLNIASRKVLLKAGFRAFDTKKEGEKELQVFIAEK